MVEKRQTAKEVRLKLHLQNRSYLHKLCGHRATKIAKLSQNALIYNLYKEKENRVCISNNIIIIIWTHADFRETLSLIPREQWPRDVGSTEVVTNLCCLT
jgi:hypothetical protein